jgi:hypothetical protein
VKCEKWIRDDDNGSEESKATWWLNRIIGRTKRVTVDWPFAFAEGKLFVLTISAGFEGYHVNVDGRHATSFPYRTVSIIICNLFSQFKCGSLLRLFINVYRDLIWRMPLG